MTLDFLFKKSLLLFLSIFFIYLILYAHSFNAGFVTDFTGLQEKLETQAFSQFIHSYGYPIVQPLMQLINAVFYKVFLINPLVWFVYYILLHSFNTYLLVLLSKKLFNSIFKTDTFLYLLIVLMVFMASPYHPEVLTWKISTAFLWSATWILLALNYAFQFIKVGTRIGLFIALLFNAFALLTFEWGLVVLPLFILFSLIIYLSDSNKRKYIRRTSLLVFGSVVLTCIYFYLNYLSFGSFLAHYGSEVHMQFNPIYIVGNVWKYMAKHIALVHYYSYSSRNAIYTFLGNPLFIIVASISVVLSAVFIWKKAKERSKFLVLAILFLTIIICLIPVSNLSFEYLFQSENDRYGYIASIFLALIIGYVLKLASSRVLNFGLMLWIGASIFFQQGMMLNWKNNKQVFWGLMDTFQFYDAKKIYALNMPDNLGGTFLFRDFSGGSSFTDGLEYTKKQAFAGDFVEVCQYNMVGKADGVRVHQVNDSTLQVSFNQFGNWFWKRTRSSNYETEKYSVVQGEGHYKMILKEQEDAAVFIYQDGTSWKQFIWKDKMD